MKLNLKVGVALAAAVLMTGRAQASISIDLEALVLQTATPGVAADGTAVVLVSTANDSFGDLSLANGSFAVEADDFVLGIFELAGGIAAGNMTFNLDAALTSGDDLLLVWYPGLSFVSNPTGPGENQAFGTYRSDSTEANNAAVQTSWNVPADGFGGFMVVTDSDNGGSTSPSLLVANQMTAGEVIPEPTTAVLVGLSALSLVGVIRRRK